MADVSLVSVIIPSYRGGTYLREAIASVQAQTLAEWELIIVLDGCDDDLADVVSGDARIRVFRHEQRGVSVTRNVGIMHAGSDLIAFLDDDDRMLPERLALQVDSMEDTDIGLCYSQHRYIDADGEIIAQGRSGPAQYTDLLRGGTDVLLGSMMVRRSMILELGGFNPLLPVAEDLDLIFRIARVSKTAFLPEVLLEYRQHGDNVWLGTLSDPRELRMIYDLHLWAAERHHEAENIEALKFRLSTLMSGRASLALQKAAWARSNDDLGGRIKYFLLALAAAPRAVTKLTFSSIRRNR